MYMREVNEYDKLYSLDVLGIEDRAENDQLDVLRDFKESVARKPDGRHEVGSPWIPGATLTNTNEALSRKRLANMERKLSRNEKLKGEYGGIIEEQLRAGVIVKQCAVRLQRKLAWCLTLVLSTISINDCIFTGPPLQSFLWDIMVRVRMSTNLLLGDIDRCERGG